MPSPHYEPGHSPEEHIERLCNFIICDLDELCVMAMNAETAELVESERHSIGVMEKRVELILRQLRARKTPRFRLVRNG